MTILTIRPCSLVAANSLRTSGIHPVLARLYSARGVTSLSQLDYALGGLAPPSALLQSDVAARFLADAIASYRRMTIVADYDRDGATACAVGVRGLRSMGAQVSFVVPNRFEHGYGLTPEIVRLVAGIQRSDVIITVDNGIASIDGVREAAKLGIDVVVTDHHLPGAALPDARVIVNPNQAGCLFPSKHLAGVGVMFYVLLALRAELRRRGTLNASTQPKLDPLLDLVALGTVADVVRLDANNRILVAQGLNRMRARRMHPGIAALFHVAGRDPAAASPFDLGFALGPRLNAAGRLTDMSLGVECLVTDDPQRALEIARELNEINIRRREIEGQMQDQALVHLDAYAPERRTTISLVDRGWHQGVIGIVASRLKDRFHRPTITFAPGGEGLLKGSGRSIHNFHLRDALDLVSKRLHGVIDRFGGHAMAAGLTIRADRFDEFSCAFEQVGQEWLGKDGLEHTIETDGPLEDEYYSIDFVGTIDSEVWGHGFAPPVFSDDFVVVQQRVLKDRHLKMTLERNGRRFDAIWFGHTACPWKMARVAFRLDANEYNGRTSLQLLVEHATAT